MEATEEYPPLETEFVGRKSPFFWLALKTSLLTVLTLGIYRFWMKTRLRRYIWSAIRPGGHPLEYVGTAMEKLLGFLIAVAFLAFYIGIVNLILMFLSFSLLHNNFVAYGLSFVGVIPIVFYASYRARRYVLARTRWRGIRFGLAPGAWGYAWRALVHWSITILSAGLLWPRMTFWLEKYRIDRTSFGDARFRQGGQWRMLMNPYLHWWGPMAATLGAGVMLGLTEIPGWMVVWLISLPWAYVGWFHYKAASLRLLADHKTIDGAALTSDARTRRVVRVYFLGNMITYLLLGLLAWVMLVATVVIMRQFGVTTDQVLTGQVYGPMKTAFIAVTIVTYFVVFTGWAVLRQVFVTLPLYQHYAETLSIRDPHHLTGISQTKRDEFAEAEGFAEALDVGAAI